MSQAAAYKVVTIDLSVVADSRPVPGIANAKIEFVGILDRPAGSTFYLKFGSGADAVPLTDNWVGMEFQPSHNGGVYFTNPTAQAGFVTLFFGFDQCS